MPHIITLTRTEAQDLADQIHEWRKVNIPGYNATSWAECVPSDEKFDKAHKKDAETKWEVPLPHDVDKHSTLRSLTEPKAGQEKVEKLPADWSPVEGGGL